MDSCESVETRLEAAEKRFKQAKIDSAAGGLSGPISPAYYLHDVGLLIETIAALKSALRKIRDAGCYNCSMAAQNALEEDDG